MFVDKSGAFWLSDPTLVLVLLAGAIALMVWCHRWSVTGSMPLPGNLSARRPAGRQTMTALRRRLESHPTVLAERRTVRTRRAGSHPPQAA